MPLIGARRASASPRRSARSTLDADADDLAALERAVPPGAAAGERYAAGADGDARQRAGLTAGAGPPAAILAGRGDRGTRRGPGAVAVATAPPGLGAGQRLGARGLVVRGASRAASASCWTRSRRRRRRARRLGAHRGAAAADAVVILKPDHVRDVDLFVRWYGARAFGPQLFWRDDVPRTELEPRPARATSCPAACSALVRRARRARRRRSTCPSSARSCSPTRMTAPRRRAARVGDALARGAHAARRCGPLLELPFEHVLVSHGEPVHDRDDFVAALDREPWGAYTGA